MNIPILDIPRMYTGVAEWMACMIFALRYKPRTTEKGKYLVCAVALVLQCVFLELTDDLPLFLWIPCMAAAVGLMLVLLLFLCDLDFKACAYTCVRAFILAEFTASLEWQIHCYLWPDNQAVWWQRCCLLLAVYGSVFLAAILLERRCAPREDRLYVTPHELVTTLIMGICVFAISNLSFYVKSTPFSGQNANEINNIRTFSDLCGVTILYAYHLQRMQNRAQQELSAMQSILESQYAQYRMSRDSIDMINRKYHDLKHQITALRAEPDPDARNRWLDEMEQDIKAYEAQNKTGNSILDTLLTGKSLHCQKHSIDLTVVADGKPLGFMSTMDICSLFGNALDNAIECERKLTDKSKRMIHLTLTTRKQFLLLQVENYCPEPPSFRDGLPVTTKDDTGYHGFGVKSIQLTARKYGGSAVVQVKDDWFILQVLIPIPDAADSPAADS
ncbi:MAG: ATP-binding protein [Firmicutes bacterium]|nr:ATP-binding protein [Bacillota bacterium]